jgi:hypothetical protein
MLGCGGVGLAFVEIRADRRAATDDQGKPFVPTPGALWKQDNLELYMTAGQTETDLATLRERWTSHLTSGLRNRRWAAWLSLSGLVLSAIGGVVALVQ